MLKQKLNTLAQGQIIFYVHQSSIGVNPDIPFSRFKFLSSLLRLESKHDLKGLGIKQLPFALSKLTKAKVTGMCKKH